MGTDGARTYGSTLCLISAGLQTKDHQCPGGKSIFLSYCLLGHSPMLCRYAATSWPERERAGPVGVESGPTTLLPGLLQLGGTLDASSSASC